MAARLILSRIVRYLAFKIESDETGCVYRGNRRVPASRATSAPRSTRAAVDVGCEVFLAALSCLSRVNFGSPRKLFRMIFRLRVRSITWKNSSFDKTARTSSQKKRQKCIFF
ncbi:MAG: hypothetical protein ACYCOX_16855, partial [Acidobacteriaceae bacterium]